MIDKISLYVSNWLVLKGGVSLGDRNLFAYATQCLLLGLTPILIIVLLGQSFGLLHEGLRLILPFMVIRKFSGGFHFQSAKKCLAVSVTVLAAALILTQALIVMNDKIIVPIMVILSIITLVCCSPIDTEAKRLSVQERKVFRKIAQGLSIIALVSYLTLFVVASAQYHVPFGIGIVLTASLQIPCLYKVNAK